MRIPNPETKIITQTNNSTVLGTLWSSFGLDLTENIGRIRVAPRLLLADGSAGTVPNMGLPVAFAQYSNGSSDVKVWTIAGSRAFYSDGDPDDTWTQDATASTPTTLTANCDMSVFNNAIYISGDGNLYKYNTVWTIVSSAPNGFASTHCVYKSLLYFSDDGCNVWSVDTSDVVISPTSFPNTNTYALKLREFNQEGTPATVSITSMSAASDRIWIATKNIDVFTTSTHSTGRKAVIFEWDGVATQPTRKYFIDSMGALAIFVDKEEDIPYVMDAEGRLRKFDGSGFPVIARLPVDPSKYLGSPAANVPNVFIHPKGIMKRNGRLLMLINNLNQDGTTVNENLPSGVWEYDEKIGLYHKYPISLLGADPASTRSDFGQNRVVEVGAIAPAKTVSPTDYNGDILVGARYYTSATASQYGVFTNDTNDTRPKIGYFVTQEIESSEIQDTWQKLFTKHRKLLSAADRIAVKYRTNRIDPVSATITWVNGSTFTTTDNISSIVEGDEVEVMQGAGGGQIEHIQSNLESGGTYTVTLKKPVTGASGTAKVRLQKWILSSDLSDQTKDYFEFSINQKSVKIEFKVVMYFTGKNELFEIAIANQTFKGIE